MSLNCKNLTCSSKIDCSGINATGDISATTLNVTDISCGNSLHAPNATIQCHGINTSGGPLAAGDIQCDGLNATGAGNLGDVTCKKLNCVNGDGTITCKKLSIVDGGGTLKGSLSYETTTGLTLKSIDTGLHLDANSGLSNVSAAGNADGKLIGFVVTTYNKTRANFGLVQQGSPPGIEAPSDHRIKQNISSIPPTDSLNKLSLTNPTSFNFKKDHIYSEDSLQHGFMAQELKEHFPEAVTVSTGYLPIDLSSVKVTYSDPSKTILHIANLASYEINDNTKLNITNPSGDIPVTITDFDNNTNSITLDKNIPDNFVRLRFLVDNFHYVQYDKFIPITISAIKKLKSTQDELIESIKKLTQKVELLGRKQTMKRFM